MVIIRVSGTVPIVKWNRHLTISVFSMVIIRVTATVPIVKWNRQWTISVFSMVIITVPATLLIVKWNRHFAMCGKYCSTGWRCHRWVRVAVHYHFAARVAFLFWNFWLWKEVRERHQPVANPNLKMWWVGLNHIVVDGHEPDAWPPFLFRQFQYAWVNVRGIVSRNWPSCNTSVSNSWNSFVKLTILPTPVKYVYNGIGLAIYRSRSNFWKMELRVFLL